MKARHNMGIIEALAGSSDDAELNFIEALRLGRVVNDEPFVAEALGSLAELACMRGRYDEGVGYVSEAIVIDRRLGTPHLEYVEEISRRIDARAVGDDCTP